MKVFLWLVAVLASGAVGFYFGLGYGAETLGAIAAQNSVGNGVALVRNSLDALAQGDVTRSNQLHERNLEFALVQIGTYSKRVSYLQCSDRERQTMQAASHYVQDHPDLLGGPLHELRLQGLQWCTQPKGGGA